MTSSGPELDKSVARDVDNDILLVDLCIPRASVRFLWCRGVHHCKNVVFAVGVSSTTETSISVQWCDFQFLAKSCIDFVNFESGAKIAFSYEGCRKLQNFNPHAGPGAHFCLRLAQRGGHYFASCDTPRTRMRISETTSASEKHCFYSSKCFAHMRIA